MVLKPQNLGVGTLLPTQLAQVTLMAKELVELEEEQGNYTPTLAEQVRTACDQDKDIRELRKAITAELRTLPESLSHLRSRVSMADCQIVGDQVCYKGKIWVPEGLRLQVLAAHHDAPAAGHGGQANTHALIDRSYYWPSLRRDVISYVDGCEACKRTKAFRDATAKGLHQLSVPEGPWERLACDFIIALPPSEQDGVTYENICVVTDRLTKMRRFIPMHEITARALADKFIQYVCSQFGLPQSIVTDRGKQFDSTFWKRMCEGWNCDRDMSTAFHPETDGQSENANQFLEQYLRQYCCYLQNDWVKWLPMAEFAANNHVSETTKCSPFFANYGRHPRMGTEPARSLPTGPLREKAIAVDKKV